MHGDSIIINIVMFQMTPHISHHSRALSSLGNDLTTTVVTHLAT